MGRSKQGERIGSSAVYESTGLAIQSDQWETVGMIKPGDFVVAQGHQGVFRIYTISQDGKSAEIELFNVSRQQPVGHSMGVPTSTLSPFKEGVPAKPLPAS